MVVESLVDVVAVVQKVDERGWRRAAGEHVGSATSQWGDGWTGNAQDSYLSAGRRLGLELAKADDADQECIVRAYQHVDPHAGSTRRNQLRRPAGGRGAARWDTDCHRPRRGDEVCRRLWYVAKPVLMRVVTDRSADIERRRRIRVLEYGLLEDASTGQRTSIGGVLSRATLQIECSAIDHHADHRQHRKQGNGEECDDLGGFACVLPECPLHSRYAFHSTYALEVVVSVALGFRNETSMMPSSRVWNSG